MDAPAIRLEKIWKRYGNVAALSGATFEVPPGSIFALIGPNGAGKTTAIKTMLNLVTPTRGFAEVLGTDSRSLGPELLQKIGYVSENQRLPEWMTVEYFLSYCSAFYPAWNRQETVELVSALELPLERRLQDLSRGMRMKAAIASSLAYRPTLLILDEPFSGLDVLVREQLSATILEREMTVFVASHDLSDIETFASHVAYMSDGRVLFTDQLSTLIDRFREVEVTLKNPIVLSSPRPANWWDIEQSPTLVRFVDAEFDEDRIRRAFNEARDIQIRGMSLRSIFVALAKQAR